MYLASVFAEATPRQKVAEYVRLRKKRSNYGGTSREKQKLLLMFKNNQVEA